MVSLREGEPSRTHWSIKLASSAIRCSLVETLPRSNALAIFPSIDSMPRRPLPSPGSLWARFPGLIGTMERSDFLPPIPGGSLIARRYRPCAPCFAPAAGEHYLRRAWVLVSRLPYRLFRYGDDRISRVPVRPSRYMPCSHQTPAGPERQAIQRSRCCLPLLARRRLPRVVISGLNHTACIFAVYASQRRLPERHARLASGRWPALPGRDSTRRICSEGFRNDSSHVISSPFPELCSAHARRLNEFHRSIRSCSGSGARWDE